MTRALAPVAVDTRTQSLQAVSRIPAAVAAAATALRDYSSTSAPTPALTDLLKAFDAVLEAYTLPPEAPTPPLAPEVVVKQTLIVRKDLNMPRGKQASQASHGAVNAIAKKPGAYMAETENGRELRVPVDAELDAWLTSDYRKVVLAVHSEAELLGLHAAAQLAGLHCFLVQDNGLTMFEGQKTYTALALGPHVSARIDELTGPLKPL